MKKSLSLLLLAVLPLGLVACDDGGNTPSDSEEHIDTAIGHWLEADIETFNLLYQDIELPYDKELFKAYESTSVDENGNEVKKIDTNYTMFYDDEIHKVVFTLTCENSEASKTYYDYCMGLGEYTSVTSPLEGGYKISKDLGNNNTYFIDIFNTKETEMYALAYVQTSVSFTNATQAFNYLNKDAYEFIGTESKFPVPTSTKISKVTITSGWLNSLPYFDVKVTSTDAKELDNYKKLLTDNSYKIDPAYESKNQVNYYLIDEFKDGEDDAKRAKDIMIDKVMLHNEFNMRVSLSEIEYL